MRVRIKQGPPPETRGKEDSGGDSLGHSQKPGHAGNLTDLGGLDVLVSREDPRHSGETREKPHLTNQPCSPVEQLS